MENSYFNNEGPTTFQDRWSYQKAHDESMDRIYADDVKCNAEVGAIIGSMDPESQDKVGKEVYSVFKKYNSAITKGMSMNKKMVKHFKITMKGLNEQEYDMQKKILKSYQVTEESYVSIHAMAMMQTMYRKTEKALGKPAPSCKAAVDEYVRWGANIPYEGFCNKVHPKMQSECWDRQNGKVVWSNGNALAMTIATLAVSAILF